MDKRSLKEYRIWKAMKARCYAPSQRNSYYQKDGIKVCPQWKNNFEQFMADMGKIPGDDYSIERIDITKDYCPENCKWIPKNQQPINRRNTIWITHEGETKTLKDWARHFGIEYTTLRKRVLVQNVPFEKAIDPKNFDRCVEIDGERHTVTEWCRIKGLHQGDVFSRIHRGWSKIDAIQTPIKKLNKI